MNHEGLVGGLMRSGVLKSPRIIKAFEKIDRADFVPNDLAAQAYVDTALPIGWGQTISQPTTVAFMLELLQPQRGDKILDVGSGSGWTTALCAHIAGPRGSVIGTEIIPELAAFGQLDLRKYHFKNAEIRLTDTLGAPEEAPFDRILVSATADKVPQTLVDQLRGGMLVMPIGSAIVRVHKSTNGKTALDTYEGFVFVPLKY